MHDDFCERPAHQELAPGEPDDGACVSPVQSVEGLGMWLEATPLGPMVAFDAGRGVRMALPRARQARAALDDLIATGERAESSRAS